MMIEGRKMKAMEFVSYGESPAGSPYPSAFSRLDLLQSVAKFSCQKELQDLLEPQERRSREEANRREDKRGGRG